VWPPYFKYKKYYNKGEKIAQDQDSNSQLSSQGSQIEENRNQNNQNKILLIIPKQISQEEVERYARLLFNRKIKSFKRLPKGPCIIEYETNISKLIILRF
jgi:hypothetical protein